jgi:hypothetical protein
VPLGIPTGLCPDLAAVGSVNLVHAKQL